MQAIELKIEQLQSSRAAAAAAPDKRQGQREPVAASVPPPPAANSMGALLTPRRLRGNRGSHERARRTAAVVQDEDLSQHKQGQARQQVQMDAMESKNEQIQSSRAAAAAATTTDIHSVLRDRNPWSQKEPVAEGLPPLPAANTTGSLLLTNTSVTKSGPAVRP